VNREEVSRFWLWLQAIDIKGLYVKLVLIYGRDTSGHLFAVYGGQIYCIITSLNRRVTIAIRRETRRGTRCTNKTENYSCVRRVVLWRVKLGPESFTD
jgi:hypothetical protein